MKPEYAAASSDAIAKTRHPRLDFRTAEARRYCERWRPFLETVVSPGCRVLDLGCGAGKCTFELEQLGAVAVGIDCSGEMIRLAREVAADIGSSAEFHIGLFEDLPFPDESFDLVWFPDNIIECSYEEMATIARQVAAIMRPAGRFCLTMRDGIERLDAGKEGGGGFDLLAGTQMGSIRITDEKEYPYETIFWSVAFARFVVSRYLHFVGMQTLQEQRHALLFKKQEQSQQPGRGDAEGRAPHP